MRYARTVSPGVGALAPAEILVDLGQGICSAVIETGEKISGRSQNLQSQPELAMRTVGTPLFESLHAHPRVARILKDMKFPTR